jgi:hypothetical protein
MGEKPTAADEQAARHHDTSMPSIGNMKREAASTGPEAGSPPPARKDISIDIHPRKTE